MTGSGDQSWSPVRFHGPAVGKVVCGSEARWTFGIDGFLGGRQFLVGIDGAFWLLRLLGLIFGQLWWPTAFVELCLQWTCVRSVWFEPFRKVKGSDLKTLSNSTKLRNSETELMEWVTVVAVGIYMLPWKTANAGKTSAELWLVETAKRAGSADESITEKESQQISSAQVFENIFHPISFIFW